MPNVRSCEIVTRLLDDEGQVLFDIDKLPEVLEAKSHVIKDYALLSTIKIYILPWMKAEILSIKQEDSSLLISTCC